MAGTLEQRRRWGANRRLRLGMTPRPHRTLTLDPLLALVAQDETIARLEGQMRVAAENRALGISRDKGRRWRTGGVDAYTADQLAVRLGTHPALIWGDAWWADVEAVDA